MVREEKEKETGAVGGEEVLVNLRGLTFLSSANEYLCEFMQVLVSSCGHFKVSNFNSWNDTPICVLPRRNRGEPGYENWMNGWEEKLAAHSYA